MGLGKTLATLAAIDDLRQKKLINTEKPILIIAPISVALDTWSREAEKWGYDMAIEICVNISKKKREKLLNDLLKPRKKLTLVTTAPSQLKAINAYYKSIYQPPPFECYVVDELSMFKSHESQRFLNLQEMSDKAPYFIGLTGTPAPNSLLDIWSQVIAINPANKKWFGSDYFTYRGLYFDPDNRNRFRPNIIYTWKLKKGAKKKIYKYLKYSTMSLQTDGLLDLPDITYSELAVNLPPKARRTYDHWEKDIKKAFNESEQVQIIDVDGEKQEVASSAVLRLKLLQLASGAIYDNVLDVTDKGPPTRTYTVFHDEKLKALKDLVETSTSPILVFYWFQSDKDRVRKYVNAEFLEPKSPNFNQVVSKWNNGEIPVLLAHPASAAYGLNLQEGGHTIVWLTPPPSNEQYRQSNKRLHRSGQKHPVSVIHINARNTEDQKAWEKLDLKEDNQQDLLKNTKRKKTND